MTVPMATDELSEQTHFLVHDPERVLKVVNLMAHELRGPTSVIRGHLSMWLDNSLGPLPPEFRDSLRMAYGKTVQLTNLIEQLLLAVRLDSGALTTTPGRADLAVWLRELTHEMGEMMGATGHSLRLLVGKGPFEAMTDTRLLAAAVYNLIDNAQKFSPEGSVITIKLARKGALILLSIADQGPGLPPGFKVVALNRVDGDLGFVNPGVGLGLYIADAVAIANGGELSFESTNQGTTVTIELPAHEPAGESG